MASSRRRAEQIAAFKAELAQLRQAGLLQLDPGQRRRIESFHRAELAALETRDGADRLMGWAAMAGLTVILVFLTGLTVRYWPLMPLGAQLVLAIGAPLSFLALTDLAARTDRGGTVFGCLVTLMAFAAGLEAVAGLFNRSVGLQLLFATGLVGMLLGHAYQRLLPTGLSLVLLTVYGAGLVATADGHFLADRSLQNQDGLVFIGLAVFGAGAVGWPGGLAPAWRAAGLLSAGYGCLILSLPGVSLFGTALPYQLGGLALALAAISLGVARGWATTRLIGLLLGFGWAGVRLLDWGAALPQPVLALLLAALALVTLWLAVFTQRAAA
ncbi:MAG: hypothetical protein ACFB22_12245 [Rhodothalassiaceae bacterium]